MHWIFNPSYRRDSIALLNYNHAMGIASNQRDSKRKRFHDYIQLVVVRESDFNNYCNTVTKYCVSFVSLARCFIHSSTSNCV